MGKKGMYIITFVVFVISSISFLVSSIIHNENAIKANSHINEYISYDRNCNDCHIGKHWIKILNSANDNQIVYVLKSAGVK